MTNEIAQTKKAKIQGKIDNFPASIKERYDTSEEIVRIIEEKVSNIKPKRRHLFRVINCYTVPKAYKGTKQYMRFEATFTNSGKIKDIEIRRGYSTNSPYGGGEHIEIIPIYPLLDSEFCLPNEPDYIDKKMFMRQAIVEYIKGGN